MPIKPRSEGSAPERSRKGSSASTPSGPITRTCCDALSVKSNVLSGRNAMATGWPGFSSTISRSTSPGARGNAVASRRGLGSSWAEAAAISSATSKRANSGCDRRRANRSIDMSPSIAAGHDRPAAEPSLRPNNPDAPGESGSPALTYGIVIEIICPPATGKPTTLVSSTSSSNPIKAGTVSKTRPWPSVVPAATIAPEGLVTTTV